MNEFYEYYYRRGNRFFFRNTMNKNLKFTFSGIGKEIENFCKSAKWGDIFKIEME